jgi:hypothetical protein
MSVTRIGSAATSTTNTAIQGGQGGLVLGQEGVELTVAMDEQRGKRHWAAQHGGGAQRCAGEHPRVQLPPSDDSADSFIPDGAVGDEDARTPNTDSDSELDTEVDGRHSFTAKSREPAGQQTSRTHSSSATPGLRAVSGSVRRQQ